MADINDIFLNLQILNSDIGKLLGNSTINDYSDLSGLEINYQDGQDLFLKAQIQTILNNLLEVHNNITYLSAPIQEVGKLHKNASGRYETETGYEYYCGSNIEALVEDDWHDVPYWVQTRVEASNGQYYLYGYKDVPMDGLQVRIRL